MLQTLWFHKIVHTFATQSFLRYLNVLSYFQCDKRPAVSLVISKYDKLLIDCIYFRKQNTLWNRKQKDDEIQYFHLLHYINIFLT